MTPILPHKIGNVENFFDDINDNRRGDAEQLFRSAGMKKAIAFKQGMQAGDFLIRYCESSEDINTTLTKVASGDTQFSSFIRDQYKDFSGIDFANAKDYLKVEKLFDWKDEKKYMDNLDIYKMPWAWATPIKQGMADEVRRFWSERSSKHLKDAEDHFRSLNIVRMHAFLQSLPQGDFLVQYMCTSEQLDKVLLKCMTQNTPSSQYVKSEYHKFSGIDYSKEENLPNVQMLFDWDDSRGFQEAEQEIVYTE
jgi:hypothetical protein